MKALLKMVLCGEPQDVKDHDVGACDVKLSVGLEMTMAQSQAWSVRVGTGYA